MAMGFSYDKSTGKMYCEACIKMGEQKNHIYNWVHDLQNVKHDKARSYRRSQNKC